MFGNYVHYETFQGLFILPNSYFRVWVRETKIIFKQCLINLVSRARHTISGIEICSSKTGVEIAVLYHRQEVMRDLNLMAYEIANISNSNKLLDMLYKLLNYLTLDLKNVLYFVK